jgi:hypothetical protein
MLTQRGVPNHREFEPADKVVAGDGRASAGDRTGCLSLGRWIQERGLGSTRRSSLPAPHGSANGEAIRGQLSIRSLDLAPSRGFG